MVTRPYLAGLAPLLAVTLAACELEEVTVQGGEPMLVVSAVMRPDLRAQFVIVERSFDGVLEPTSETGAIPPNFPRVPVADAMVTVANLDLPGDPCGSPVVFGRASPEPPVVQAPGVYWSPAGCPTMRPGDRLTLRVETATGEVVEGTTRVPGMDAAYLAVRQDSVVLPVDSATTFNRDRDTLRLGVAGALGRLLQVEVRRYEDINDAGAKIYADTTAITLAGSAVNVFLSGDGEDVFRGGRSYAITVALADTNYFDFARSRNNGITGRGFINHLTGGVGVFGSLVAATGRVWVVADTEDPREGSYRITGTLNGIPVDLTLGIYLARPTARSELSALLQGEWVQLTSAGPEGALEWRSDSLSGESADGTFSGDTLVVEMPVRAPLSLRYRLEGLRVPGEAFAVTVIDATGLVEGPVGTLTALQR